MVWWRESGSIEEARAREREFKEFYGEPPSLRTEYAACKDGARLMHRLIEAAGPQSWEAGFIEAVFAVGEKFDLLFAPRFSAVWERVGGRPHGPWDSSTDTPGKARGQ